MLFSNGARFHGQMTTHPNGDLQAFRSDKQDTAHVGPGVYYSSNEENKRMGWGKERFSAKMSKQTREIDRSHHYIAGVLVGSGLAIAGTPSLRPSPGPGHYEHDLNGTFILQSPNKKLSSSGRGSGFHTMGSSPKNATQGTVLRDGVLFSSREGNLPPSPGPGHYTAPPGHSTLITKSHNVRVSPTKSPRSPSRGTSSLRQSPSSRLMSPSQSPQSLAGRVGGGGRRPMSAGTPRSHSHRSRGGDYAGGASAASYGGDWTSGLYSEDNDG